MSGAAFDERGTVTADHAVSSPAHCRAKTANAVSPGKCSATYLPAAQFSGQVVGPVIGGQIGVALGLHSVFFMTGALLAACAGLAHWARGRYRLAGGSRAGVGWAQLRAPRRRTTATLAFAARCDCRRGRHRTARLPIAFDMAFT
ncbi:hypothetical protein B7G54_10695 [Burkholderia puraquae]|uniref:Uncharacterized protein n=1 Tax=Burkholderia puraquae TaxID=1904757 RepID=A0A1X1PJY2_9BURK|nr:hypothetical protein B7G54_10695 [Burkholderia puraquae]CAB3771215.1 hypothetical protein LMG29660_06830 [Burkholderia puraquae]